MIYGIFTALFLGIFLGQTSDLYIFDVVLEYKELALYGLMFSVGISIGLHEGVLNEIKQYGFRVFLIPVSIIFGSIFGGIMASFFTKYNVSESIAIAGGLGWYSLSGVTITNIAGPEVGSVAFLSNLMRELISFLLVCPVAKHLGFITAIAPAAATSEDTLLPLLMQHTDEETVVLSIFNGVICSAAVPFLIAFAFGMA